MLKELRIHNLILIENAEIQFAHGFNVLSGESGAGKSAIMQALAMIAGARSDSGVIRRGAEKAVIEAIFEIDSLADLHSKLENAGIDHEPGSELFIRREISATGKSRAFINNQLAQLGLLKEVSACLFDIVSQHAHQKLLSLENHRHLIDLFGGLEPFKEAFAMCWEEEKKTAHELETLIQSELQRAKELELCQKTVEELADANVKDGEEEQLFAEYSRLSNADTLIAKVNEILRVLQGDKVNALSQLNRLKVPFEQLIELAPELSEAAKSFESILLELQEIIHQLHRFEQHVEFNPHKTSAINKRLELINSLKRKYALSSDQFSSYLVQVQKRLYTLENAEAEIEELQHKKEQLAKKSSELAQLLSEKRKQALQHFQIKMVEQLQSLNMPKAEFYVELAPQKRTSSGDDRIEFFIIPNTGEFKVAVRECASGGELSRIMLAIQTLLAGKENIPTLIFDEIDGNIGGETAVIVGQKLQEIGCQHQVLCITHFHQVAIQAATHLRVQKREIAGRTLSLVDLLDPSTREEELARMRGHR